jgi:hypothetical protein
MSSQEVFLLFEEDAALLGTEWSSLLAASGRLERLSRRSQWQCSCEKNQSMKELEAAIVSEEVKQKSTDCVATETEWYC